MNIPKKYIKMCEQAVKIQEKKLKQAADFNSLVWCKRQDEGHELVKGFCCFSAEERSDCCIWLPRQDELQKMLGNVPDSAGWFILRNFVEENGWYIKDELTGSWEMLWLAIVMKTLYNKKWDGNQWVMED